MQHEIAGPVQLEPVDAVERQPDRPRVGARTDDEVVFELPLLGAVVDQVDAGVDVAIGHARVCRHIRAPAAGIAADERVASPGQGVEPLDPSCRIRGDEPHANRAPSRREHGVGRGEEHRHSARASQEFHARVALAKVRLEAEGKRSIGVGQPGLGRRLSHGRPGCRDAQEHDETRCPSYLRAEGHGP